MATSNGTPTILIVPGAWHKEIHVRALMDALEERNYRTRCVELATVTTHKSRPTWDDEVNRIVSQVQEELKTGHDAALFLHSYAGLPGTEAVNRLVQAGALEQRPGQGRLRNVLFFAAHHFPTGFVVDTKAFVGPANPSFHIDDNDMAIYDMPYEMFFTDIATKEEAQPYVDEITPMYYIPGGGAIASDDWLQVPRTIIGAGKDKAIVPDFLKQLWAGYEEEIVWIDTGHSPFITMPDHIADVIIEGMKNSVSRKRGET